MENNQVVGLDEANIVAQNTSVDDIESELVNLCFIAVDCSSSMMNYEKIMEASLIDFKDAISKSKEADEMLVARADFNGFIKISGYKKINELNTDYKSVGGTRLYDVIIEGADKFNAYSTYLKNQGIRVKSVFAVFTDGEDTQSTSSVNDAKAKIAELNQKEVVTAFICFGSEAKKEAQNLAIRNVLSVGANAKELRKAFNVLSKSVIAASKTVVLKQDDFFTV